MADGTNIPRLVLFAVASQPKARDGHDRHINAMYAM
jgi:hypothetical protein